LHNLLDWPLRGKHAPQAFKSTWYTGAILWSIWGQAHPARANSAE
jgi:hypothetical protein